MAMFLRRSASSANLLLAEGCKNRELERQCNYWRTLCEHPLFEANDELLKSYAHLIISHGVFNDSLQRLALTNDSPLRQKEVKRVRLELLLICLRLRYIYTHLLHGPQRRADLDAEIAALDNAIEKDTPPSAVHAPKMVSIWLQPLTVTAWQQFFYRYFSPSAWREWWQNLEVSSRSFRQNFVEVNWFRLFFVRTKRVFDVIFPVGRSGYFSQFTRRLFSYMAWIFYVPRLLHHGYLLLAHTFTWAPGGFRAQASKAKGLSLKDRFNAQWQLRWFETLNDAVWATVGLLCCFVLAPVPAMMLTVALYAFDFTMALVRRYQCNSKFHQVVDAFAAQAKMLDEQLKQPALCLEERRSLGRRRARCNGYLAQLHTKLAADDANHLCSIMTTLSIWLGMIGGLCAMVVPGAPVALSAAAAAWVVLTCVASKVAQNILESREKSWALENDVAPWGLSLSSADDEGGKPQGDSLAATSLHSPVNAFPLTARGSSLTNFGLFRLAQSKSAPNLTDDNDSQRLPACHRTVSSPNSGV